jgi:hypothetical protein
MMANQRSVISTHEDDDAGIMVPISIVVLCEEEIEDTLISLLVGGWELVDTRHLAPANFVPVGDVTREFAGNGTRYCSGCFFLLYILGSLFGVGGSDFRSVAMVLDDDSGYDWCGIIISQAELCGIGKERM